MSLIWFHFFRQFVYHANSFWITVQSLFHYTHVTQKLDSDGHRNTKKNIATKFASVDNHHFIIDMWVAFLILYYVKMILPYYSIWKWNMKYAIGFVVSCFVVSVIDIIHSPISFNVTDSANVALLTHSQWRIWVKWYISNHNKTPQNPTVALSLGVSFVSKAPITNMD